MSRKPQPEPESADGLTLDEDMPEDELEGEYVEDLEPEDEDKLEDD